MTAEQTKAQPETRHSEVRSDALLADCIIACNILQDAPELNPSNYDHEDVCRLNAAACEAYQILNNAIKTANKGITGNRIADEAKGGAE